MPKPRLLDLFCGAGGAAMGYHRAGFDVVGVDIEPQPNYPFEFHQGDALEMVKAAWDMFAANQMGVWNPPFVFHAIHASPPCQTYTTMSNRWRGKGGVADDHPNLIPATRELLQATGLPYVIENVPGARSHLHAPVVINGGAVGLPRLDRPRLFETNWALMVPPRVPADNPVGVYGKAHDGRLLFKRANGSEQHAAASLEDGSDAMGIDWMEWRELAESVPPAYTELIGWQLRYHCDRVPVAPETKET